MAHAQRRDHHGITLGAGGAADLIIIGKMIGESGKAADLLQHAAGERDSRAHAGISQAQAGGQHHIGQEFVGCPHRRQRGPETVIAVDHFARIEACD